MGFLDIFKKIFSEDSQKEQSEKSAQEVSETKFVSTTHHPSSNFPKPKISDEHKKVDTSTNETQGTANTVPPTSKVIVPDLPKAADRHGLFRLLSYAYKANSAYHNGKMKNGFITINKLDSDCKITYSLETPPPNSPNLYSCSVKDFLQQNVRIKICDYFFPEVVKAEQAYTIPDKFDEKQKAVISLDKGVHLVLAPAGCGKTEILAHRVYRAILNGVNTEDMMCLTFTNRASRGMRTRVRELLGDRANSLFIGNTHRFCSQFLFQNNIINQSSAILDDDDILSIINAYSNYVIGNADPNIDAASLSFEQRKRLTAVIQIQHLMQQYRLGHPKEIVLSQESDYIGYDTPEKFFSPQLFADLCRAVGKPVSIQSLLEIYDSSQNTEYNNIPSSLHRILDLLAVARYFETYKESENLVDFEDLLLLTYEYARHNPTEIKKYKWVQIDEVQDLNRLQYAIVDLFTDKENVTVYLGDEQQAIFSFIGAKLDTLEWLKNRCSTNLHHLDKCYRSPKFLLDVFNHYANYQLHTDPDFLPKPNNMDSPNYGDLRIHYSESNDTAVVDAVTYALEHSDERTAIIVSSNADADNISQALGDQPHFKISGTDLFSTNEIKFLISHLNVLNYEVNFIAWARIMWLLGLFKKYSDSRAFVSKLRFAGLSPADLLMYDKSSYLLEFCNAYASTQPIVIFDTETTGLDIFSNDIVQIAAIKIQNGELIDKLNIILHTEQKIPEKLGKLDNPLIPEYASREHLSREVGLSKFFDFAKGSVLIGHNVEYDYNILDNNCKRNAPQLNVKKEFPIYFDTLKLARLVCPKLKSFKLKDLLTVLRLDGENSHLADDDIIATKSVADYCYNQARSKETDIKGILCLSGELSKAFKEKYGRYYIDAKKNLYIRVTDEKSALVSELQKLYTDFTTNGTIKCVDKFKHICSYLTFEVVDNNTEPSLYEQLSNHIMDINTLKEADLCDESIDSAIVTEKIFVSTVHKAKGLEFENVVVFGCVDGVYPFFASKDDPVACQEDARKLYVAMTRARKRLCFLSFNKRTGISRWGNPYSFDVPVSPFLIGVLSKFHFTTT